MASDTKIEWADDTVNAWWGCTKVSPACAHCYAEGIAKRVGRNAWGDNAPRWLRVEKAIAELDAIARRGDREGRPRRVFLQSMSDVFEARDDLRDPRARLFEALHRLGRRIVPMLLTKREEVAGEEIRRLGLPEGAWVGMTVENCSTAARRLHRLCAIAAEVRFVSCEPLLDDVAADVGRFLGEEEESGDGPFHWASAVDAQLARGLQWVIVGGESGGHARPLHPAWVRGLRNVCIEAHVPFFFKQWGEWGPRSSGNYTAPLEVSPGVSMWRVGKAAAGRLLDGVEWSEVPGGQ